MVVAISDVAQVAISLGPAIVTGAVGYTAARLQYLGQRVKPLDEHRTMRREAYLAFLQAVLAYHMFLGSGEREGETDGQALARLNALEDACRNAMPQVYVVGTNAVTTATRDWGDVHGRISHDLGDASLPFWQGVERTFAENRQALDESWDSLVRAMRADVSPAALLRLPD
jgi:hypothetical protein